MENNQEQTNKDKHLFSFGKINKYYFLPFFAPIICFMSNVFINEAKEGTQNNELFFIIIGEFTYVLSGLLYFISSIRTKTEKSKDNSENKQSKNEIMLIYNNPNPSENNKLKILGIFLFSSIFVSLSFVRANYLSSEDNLIERRYYYLIILSIFSKYLLKERILKHHKLSMFLVLISFILYFFGLFPKMEKDIFINIVNFVISIGYCLFLIFIKILIENYYISPFKCLLNIGLLSMIISFLGFTIYYLITNNLSKLNNNFNFSGKEFSFYIFIILFLILGSCLQIFTFLIVFYFSPILLTITDSISPMSFYIYLLIRKKNPFNDEVYMIILKISGFLLYIIASIIYNEIIICNFCGLNKNTKKCLQERQNEELSLIEIEDTPIADEEN